jgi:prolyl-tRNA synthetase
MSKEEGITVKKDEDFSEWFTQLYSKNDLVDLRYNVKGFVVYRYWCVKSMKKMYSLFEESLERKGHKPHIFPSVIPESNFKMESEHVEGFTPQVFWVTEHGDGEKFEERLALRPTSETAMYQMYSLWIRSYNDLPFKAYQSCQVWRYESKATRPFFRGREFYWIEAHDVFSSLKEAEAQVKEDMETTREVMYEKFAIPFIFFDRPQWDKFAGALHTYAADTMMPSGKVLQLPSTHLLGQNFSKPFNVQFKDKEGNMQYGFITCYGPAISRIYGALIAMHGDDKGLILPFDLAPIQIVLVPILFADSKEKVLEKCRQLKNELKEYAVEIDENENYSPGYKFHDYEMKGVPIRIEVGPKDLEKKHFMVFRRDLNKKEAVKEEDLIKEIKKIVSEFTENLKKRADTYFNSTLSEAKNRDELKKELDKGKLVKCNFCSNEMKGVKCAEIIEKELQGNVRGIRHDKNEKPEGNCLICGEKAEAVVYIAKSY